MSYKNCVPKNFKHCTFQFDIDGTGKFFSNRLLSQWFYQNYKSQFPKNAIEKTILQSYTNDLALLRKQDLPREVVSFIKQLSKNVKKELSESPSTSSSAGTPTYTVYNPNNCNVGSHGTIIIDSKQERDLTREQGRSPKKREQVVPITRVTSEQQQQRHRSPVNKGADDDDDNDEEEQQQSSIDAIDRFFSRNENDQTCHDGDDCITLPGPAAVLSKDIDIGSEPEYGPDDGFEEEHEQRRQPNEDRRLPNENDDDETLQAGRDNTTTVTSNKFRSLIFEKGYKLFKGHLDLYDILEINTAKQNVQPSTLGEYLDHFSHHLIGLKQTTPINETLKLSLSRIIYLVGGDSVEIYDNFFKQQTNIKATYEGLLLKKPSLPPGMTTDMGLAYDEIVKEAISGKNAARKLICAKKYALLDQEVNDSEIMQMLDILDIVIASLPDRNQATSSPVNNQTELTHYRRVASFLDIIFRKTGLEMKDGETCSKATKEVRKHNARTYNDNDKKVIVGRRIDLLLSTMGIELGSSEWKKDSTSPGLGKQQQVKNARTNKAILRTLEKMSMDDNERDGLFVLGMDWIGQNGYMIAVKHVDDGYCAYHMGDMMIPPTLNNLKDFKSTLNLLYQYKHHLINMTEIVEPAFYREQAKSKLHTYRLPSNPKRPPSPDTLFTPVKKKTKQTNANKNDHDHDNESESDNEYD